jgi:putative peptidoglycan lipid II flippase
LANRQEGELSAYQAAYLFFQLPHAVVAVSIMTALLPDLARQWTLGQVEGFRRQVSVGLRTMAAVLVPAAAGYALLGGPLVRVVLEHGHLGAGSAETTGTLLTLFALGLPGFSTYLLFTRAFQAMRDTRTVFGLYAFENAVNIGLALALYPGLGVRGLAIAYAAAYALAALVGGLALRRRIGGLDGRQLGRSLARIVLATGCMTVAVALVVAAARPPLLEAGAGVAAGVTVYLLAARIFGVRELTALLRIRRPSA